MLLLVVCLLVVAAAPRPNLVLMMADDHRHNFFGAYGDRLAHTPNLDGLIRRGFSFSNAYCQGANMRAVCAPSRNMFFSARSYHRFGAFAARDDFNLVSVMHSLGYRTYFHGKKDNEAQDIHANFDLVKYVFAAARQHGEPGKDIVDGALEYLRVNVTSNKEPFYMHLSFASPHDPRIAKRRYYSLFNRTAVDVPGNFMPVHPFDTGDLILRDELLAPFPRTKHVVKKHLRDYYAVIAALDEQIGRLLAALPDNTLVVYTSDHGVAIGSHGLMGKQVLKYRFRISARSLQSLYDHSMRIPLIFAGAGVPPGSSDALLYNFDIVPTLLALLHADVPSDTLLDGQSAAALLLPRAPSTARRRARLFLSYRTLIRAIREPQHKLIHYLESNVTQLFDLDADPLELRNLATDRRYAARVAAMFAAMRAEQRAFGDGATLFPAVPKSSVFVPPTPQDIDDMIKARAARFRAARQAAGAKFRHAP